MPLALPVAVLVGWSLIGSGLLAARSRRQDHLALAPTSPPPPATAPG